MTDQDTVQFAEVAVNGCLLLWPEELAGRIFDRLRPADFQNTTQRAIFSAAWDLFLAAKPVDPVLVADKLGDAYTPVLADIMRQTPTNAQWEEYVSIVRDSARFTRIKNACFHIATNSVNLSDALRLLAEASSLLVDQNDNRESTIAELVHAFLDRQNDPTPPDYLDWGIPALNEILLLPKASFVVIGADSSVGKTALALQFSLNFARQGKRVGFFSYETPRDLLANRLIANEADVSLYRSKMKKLTPAEILRVMTMGENVNEMPLILRDSAGDTVEDLRAKILSLRLDVAVIDYVQLIPSKGYDATQQVRQISMDLHRLSLQLGITIIGLSQVTVPPLDKKGQRRYITPDDLRESRQLKNDAEAILLLDLTVPTDRSSNRVLQIGKNKDDKLGHITLEFNPHRMRFSYLPPYQDPKEKAAAALNAKKDANRADRQAAEAKKAKAAIDGQGTFTDLDDKDGPLPF